MGGVRAGSAGRPYIQHHAGCVVFVEQDSGDKRSWH